MALDREENEICKCELLNNGKFQKAWHRLILLGKFFRGMGMKQLDGLQRSEGAM